jgi:molybdate transport system permease protein
MNPTPPTTPSSRGDLPFLLILGVIGGSYLVLIVAMLAADAFFTTPGHLWEALQSREIRYAVKLSLVSCCITAILSVWVAVPLGYLMSRWDDTPIRDFLDRAGRVRPLARLLNPKLLIDALLDIPIVLPPLVIGLSLLIFFQTPPGRAIESVVEHHLGFVIVRIVLPLAALLTVLAVLRIGQPFAGRRLGTVLGWLLPILVGLAVLLVLLYSRLGFRLQTTLQREFAGPITYGVPSVILAQFAVACAFAVRTMRVTFDQITPRQEQVALTLGCSRSQAFWLVVLPEARRGIITAGTLAWARALGEFGPILVFSGATRMRTEVLSTTVFLELSVGRLEAAVAVSLLMVAAALVVLVIVRMFGLEAAR